MKLAAYTILIMILLNISTRTSSIAQDQDKYTLSGYIKDQASGEDMIGATIYIKEIRIGTQTNAYGFYSITLPPGTYNILIKYIGYDDIEDEIELNKNISLNYLLDPENILEEELVVTGESEYDHVTSIQMSTHKLDINQVRKLPTLLGEVDIIKIIQMRPGVITAGEGTSSFYVRGGSADQNLILIDEAPVYDPSHLFGIFSVFNADVIKDAELYKGGIPARYGGRLSSVLDIRTIDGNNQKFNAKGGIGFLASRLSVQGPIKKNKSSYMISGRRSYADLILKAAKSNTVVGFYDINAKINWKPNNKNRFFLALYTGKDNFTLAPDSTDSEAADESIDFGWNNTTGTFRWNHLFNDRVFFNSSLIASQFNFLFSYQSRLLNMKWSSYVRQLSLHNDLSYFINPKNNITIGYHISSRSFQPGTITSREGSSFNSTKLSNQYALDHAFYINHKTTLGSKLDIEYGLRLSIFQPTGKSDVPLYKDPKDNTNITRTDTLHYKRFEPIKTYTNLEPRVSARYMINESSSIKASYNRMVQNLHQMSNSVVPLPFSTWNPSNYYLKPQVADQVAIGYFKNLNKNQWKLALETYYKDSYNVTDFADNADLILNQDITTEFRQGTSTAYGLELSAEKTTGIITSFLGYTWSKVTRQTDGVNQNKEYPAGYDRRHVINLNTVYNLSDEWALGLNFTYSTGRPTTLPSGSYVLDDLATSTNQSSFRPVDLYTGRNGYRLPDFHRLDLSATYTSKKSQSKRWKSQWIFSIYNVYNRKNPFFIYIGDEIESGSVNNPSKYRRQAKMVYLFPIIPQVTYNFNF